ncbi:MAG TPA: ornithine cyclodeaminase family protein, partial [Acidobacteriota bacterium]|nr:ornithine cyclodeaminase family protein [Acidobacteriota bacterium]
MLVLNQKDILNAVTRNEIVDSVEKALRMYEEKKFHMPDRMHVDYRGNTLLLMPCFTKKSMGTKLVSLYPQNEKKDLPVLFGVMVLNDGNTGKPLAVLDGSALTALRTGAVGSVSIRHMTSKKVSILGIVGAGVQGFHQTITACTQRDFKSVYVYDKFSEKSDQLIEKLLKKLKNIKVKKAKKAEELLEEAEVVITATTSTEPV